MSALREPARFVQEAVSAARGNLNRCRSDLSAYAKGEPEKAILSTLGAGYVLRMLPVASLVHLFVRTVLALFEPVAFVFGAAKLWEKVRNGASAEPKIEGS